MKDNSIKAIIFDLGGVVVKSGFRKLLTETIPGLNSSKELKKRIKSLEREISLGIINEEELALKLISEFDVRLSKKAIQEFIYENMDPDLELIKMIPKISSVKKALLSNTLGGITDKVLARPELNPGKLFDKVFLSHEINLIKPSLTAYQHVVNSFGINPEQALLVDDRRENIEEAKKFGMKGVVYENAQDLRQTLIRNKVAVTA